MELSFLPFKNEIMDIKEQEKKRKECQVNN